MMLDLKYVKLPDYIVTLLLKGYNDSQESLNSLAQFIYMNRPLQGIIVKYFQNGPHDTNIPQILRRVTLTNFYRMLISLIVDYQENGRFPLEINPSLADDIFAFSEILSPFVVGSNNRPLLLSVYLYLGIQIQEGSVDRDDFLNYAYELESYFKRSKRKSSKLDQLFILLHFLYHFLGANQLDLRIDSGAPFMSLIDELDEEQKRILSEAFLSYCSSIGETELFSMRKV